MSGSQAGRLLGISLLVILLGTLLVHAASDGHGLFFSLVEAVGSTIAFVGAAGTGMSIPFTSLEGRR